MNKEMKKYVLVGSGGKLFDGQGFTYNEEEAKIYSLSGARKAENELYEGGITVYVGESLASE